MTVPVVLTATTTMTMPTLSSSSLPMSTTTGLMPNEWGCYGQDRLCYIQQYTMIDGMAVQSRELPQCLPVNSTGMCPCNTEYETKCQEGSGNAVSSYCQENAIPCPCPASKHECWVSVYNSD